MRTQRPVCDKHYELKTFFLFLLLLSLLLLLLLLCVICVRVGVQVPPPTYEGSPLLQLGIESGCQASAGMLSLLGHLTSP